MSYLIDTSKALNELLETKFKTLKDSGEIMPGISYGEWLAFKGFIVEPVISKSVKEIVFDHLTHLERFKPIKTKYQSMADLIARAEGREAVYIKQLSIYMYRQTFAENPRLSTTDIGVLHDTTKQNVSKTIDTVADWAAVMPEVKEHINTLARLIAEAKNNNNLKIS